MNYTKTATCPLMTFQFKKHYIYIFFCDSNHSLSWMLKPGFVHIFFIIQQDNNFILCNPRFEQMDICYLKNTTEEKILRGYKKVYTTYLKIPLFIQGDKFKFRLNIKFTCVGILKYILGIKNIFMATPYQLYKYLKPLSL